MADFVGLAFVLLAGVFVERQIDFVVDYDVLVLECSAGGDCQVVCYARGCLVYLLGEGECGGDICW